MKKNRNLKVAIVMGSQSDYKTMKLAEKVLKNIGVSFETKIISAHRTPKRMYEFASSAKKNNFGTSGSQNGYKAVSHLLVLAHNVFA